MSRFAVGLAAIAAVLLVVGAYGAVKYRPSLRSRTTERKAALAAPRPKVAIIGVRNELGAAELKWLPTAVNELVAHEVAAAEASLRLIGTDWVDLEHRSLGVTADDVGDEKTEKRLQALLDADVFVYGVLTFAQPQTDRVRLRVRALETTSSKERGRLDEDLGPDGTRLLEAMSGAGTGIRKLLGVSLSSEEKRALASSRAQNLDAAKSYAEGVMAKHRWDLEGARSHFEAALAADPGFLQAKEELACTLIAQYDRKKAVEVLKSIQATPAALTARQAALVDLRITQDPDKLRALFEAAPDDLGMWPGLALASRLPARAGLQVLKRMQHLRAGLPLHLELREAGAAVGTDERQRGEELLDHVVRQATELGARWELAQARASQASLVSPDDPTSRRSALDRLREAERLYAEVGEADSLAEAKRGRAAWLAASGSRREALAAMDDAAGWFRRLGNRELLARTLLSTADYLRDLGELTAARRRLDEARRELEALDAPRDGIGFFNVYTMRAWQDFDAGNLDATREGIRAARRTTWNNSFPEVVALLEASVLDEGDHIQQARAEYSKALIDAQERFAAMCPIDCDGDNPAAGLECLAKKCRGDDPNFVGLRKARCHLDEARCRVRGNDLARADRAARAAAALLESKDDYELALLTRSVLMRVAASRGEAAKAIRVLRADLAKMESEGNKRLAFETGLALGAVELKAGRLEGRARLAKLEEEAKSREFFRIARLARELLDQKPLASAKPHR